VHIAAREAAWRTVQWFDQLGIMEDRPQLSVTFIAQCSPGRAGEAVDRHANLKNAGTVRRDAVGFSYHRFPLLRLRCAALASISRAELDRRM
jgi:hypothetical protein